MRTRVAIAAGVLAAVVVAGQLVLPPVAERRLRDDLAANGDVRGVEIAAFPALKLLFGRADRVEVRLAETRLGGGTLADLLARTRQTGELDARADVLRVGPLLVRDLRLAKEGDVLRSEAALTDADLRAALPAQLGLRPVRSDAGGLVLEATAGGLAVRARLSALDGALVIAPEGLLGSFATLTLFRDPRVSVTSVGARARPDGFTFTASARVT